MKKTYIGIEEFIGKKNGNVFFINENCIRGFTNKKIYIFGAGEDGQNVYKLLKKLNIEVEGYIDNGVAINEYRELNGIKIYNPYIIKNKKKFFIIIASRKYDREMVRQVHKMGYIARDDFGVWIFESMTLREKIRWEIKSPFDHSFIYTCIRRNAIDFIMGWLRSHRIIPFYKGYEKIDALRNKYIGERCFILCSGPSLIKDDIVKLSNEYTFGINSFFLVAKKINWKPTFYFTTHEPTIKEIFVDNKLSSSDICKKYMFATDNCKSLSRYGELTLVPMLALNPYYYSGFSPQVLRHSNDALIGLYEYSCTTMMCIDLAMYMGFSKIYILGADNDYLGDVSYTSEIEDYERKHAHKRDYRTFLDYRSAILQMKANEVCYEYLNKIAKSKGIQIYNATRGGKLEVYPRVNLDEIL